VAVCGDDAAAPKMEYGGGEVLGELGEKIGAAEKLA
jgi:hypothetical protein